MQRKGMGVFLGNHQLASNIVEPTVPSNIEMKQWEILITCFP